jgi:hypothetical protein
MIKELSEKTTSLQDQVKEIEVLHSLITVHAIRIPQTL